MASYIVLIVSSVLLQQTFAEYYPAAAAYNVYDHSHTTNLLNLFIYKIYSTIIFFLPLKIRLNTTRVHVLCA